VNRLHRWYCRSGVWAATMRDQLPWVLRGVELGDEVLEVDVVTGDATAMPFQAARFSAVVSFTMLHHVTSPELQDRLLAEVCRVLRPGGVFAGSDSTASFLFHLAHLGDTMVLVDPDRFVSRLQAAGFTDARVRRGDRAFSFRAIRPPAPSGT